MAERFLWEQALSPIASSSQAAVTATVTTTQTTTTLKADLASCVTLLNRIRADLITAGIIKGSA